MKSTRKVASVIAVKAVLGSSKKPRKVPTSLKTAGTKSPSVLLKTKNVLSKRSPIILIRDKTGKTRPPKAAVTNKRLSKSTRLDKKIAAITKLHASKSSTSVVGTFKAGSAHVSSKPKNALAVLSMYRFPIEPKAIAVGVARYGGIFFVAIGAFFTLFSLNNSLLFGGVPYPHALTAASGNSIVTHTSGTGSTNSGPGNSTSGPTINCTDPLQYVSASCADLVDHKPAPAFDIDASHALSGTVKVRIKVDHAASVSLTSYNSSAAQEYRIGSMSKVSDDTWELYWDTSNFLDGSYIIKALVSNGYGSYEQANQQEIKVENNPLPMDGNGTTSNDEVGDASGAAGPAGSSVEEETATSADPLSVSLEPTALAIALTVDKTIGSTEFNFSIAADKADSIKMTAQQKTSGKSLVLGYAYKSNGSGWKFRWTPVSYQDGDYIVTAQAISGSLQTVSNTVHVIKKTNSTSATTSPAAAVVPIVTPRATSDAQLAPAITVSTLASSPLSGIIDLKVNVDAATGIEVYAQKRYSLVRTYLGKAVAIDNGVWQYRWDTRQSPNAEYALVAVVKNPYGTYEGQSNFVTVSNSVVVPLSATQESHVEMLKTIAAEAILPEPLASTTTKKTEALFDGEDKVAAAMSTYEVKINSDLDTLAAALRVKDQASIDAAKESLAATKAEILSKNPDLSTAPEAPAFLDDSLNDRIEKVTKNVQIVDTLISKRTDGAASLDSDADGVSDYDEVNIYRTNAFAADTDGDGVPDGAEILKGHDPLNAATESLVAFASPKDSGIVRDDILKVNSITTASKNPDSSTTSDPIAIISGTALPNSFITLYIFSTPIVVTVKSDTEGNWDYHFDKELEDGTHQIYIGITDNSGQVIAKSKPFSFVKEAQAFSQAEQTDTTAPAPVAQSRPSLFSEYMVYVVLSISVVAIGLVLIMLGLHLETRAKRSLALPEETSSAV